MKTFSARAPQGMRSAPDRPAAYRRVTTAVGSVGRRGKGDEWVRLTAQLGRSPQLRRIAQLQEKVDARPLPKSQLTIQRYLNPAAIANYVSARDAWDEAVDNVRRFDDEIDQEIPGRWAANNATLTTIAGNVLAKSVRAKGTMAGEAYETREWDVGVPMHGGAWVNGPGGGAGVDVMRYSPGLGVHIPHAGVRQQVEVKTAQSVPTMRQALCNNGNVALGDTIKLYYHGPPADVWGVIGTNWVNHGTQYHAEHLWGANPPNFATVHAYRSDGTTGITNFRIRW